MCSTIHSVQSSWSENSFLEQWQGEILQSAKKAKIDRKTSTASQVPRQIARFGIQMIALDLLYNSSHTFVLFRRVVHKAFPCRNGQNRQKFQAGLQTYRPAPPLKITFLLITSQPDLQMTREGYILHQHIELYQIPLNMIFSTEIGGPMDPYIQMAAPRKLDWKIFYQIDQS